MRIRAFASVATALLFAGLPAAAVFFAITGAVYVPLPAFILAVGHAVILGLPSFLLGRSLGRVNLVSAAVVGFVIGVIPFTLFTLLVDLTQRSVNITSSDGVPLVINGVTTWAGWLGILVPWILFGGLGALGGITFCLILKLTGCYPRRHRSDCAGHPQ